MCRYLLAFAVYPRTSPRRKCCCCVQVLAFAYFRRPRSMRQRTQVPAFACSYTTSSLSGLAYAGALVRLCSRRPRSLIEFLYACARVRVCFNVIALFAPVLCRCSRLRTSSRATSSTLSSDQVRRSASRRARRPSTFGDFSCRRPHVRCVPHLLPYYSSHSLTAVFLLRKCRTRGHPHGLLRRPFFPPASRELRKSVAQAFLTCVHSLFLEFCFLKFILTSTFFVKYLALRLNISLSGDVTR